MQYINEHQSKEAGKLTIRAFLIVLCAYLFIVGVSCASTPKKPTLMILPSDNWCNQRYYTVPLGNEKVPDYALAFAEDTELPIVISNVGAVLTDMGYSVKDAQQELKNLKMKAAEDQVTQSRTSGAALAETPLDQLKRRIKADVVIQINWTLNNGAGGKSVSFIMEAFDSYTSKRIATATGTTKPSAASLPVLLANAVKENAKPFDKQLDRWFEAQEKNGREIVLNVRCWDNWDKSLETEYNGKELTECLQDWLRENTVNGDFNYSDGTDTFAQFEQVHIPLIDDNGRASDAYSFATKLRKHLAKPPYSIVSKVMVRGLGEATIVLGEK